MSELLSPYVNVTFDGSEKKMVTGVYQYDHGLKLRVHNFPVTAV